MATTPSYDSYQAVYIMWSTLRTRKLYWYCDVKESILCFSATSNALWSDLMGQLLRTNNTAYRNFANKILRCINFVKVRKTHVSDLHALSKLLTIKDAYKADACKFVCNVKQSVLPEIFSNYFSECRFVHNYNTR